MYLFRWILHYILLQKYISIKDAFDRLSENIFTIYYTGVLNSAHLGMNTVTGVLI